MSSYITLSDNDLVAFLKEGDKAAFTEIYNRYKGLLYIHAYNRLRNQQEADDVVHELFTSLWTKRDNLVLKTHLSGYLYQSVRNRILDIISHQRVESDYIVSLQHFIDQSEAITDHLVRENELTALIEKEISALTPKMREVFELSRKANLSHREIAQKLELSEMTVKKHVNNALKILRTRLGLVVYLLYISYY
ncbi:RNA polymerase sigma-70 factor (ECF subfamily) [Pedobacter cryoconitis]|uniref:RNA polymerase sigma-70 factor (ECF subfamily) n=1 Tax=Pedobacter cryoconitis TaxID=188932 RepID=A0A7W8ZNU6_9SPHI|nr:RNA polymerase sigma-70 factor [Pedobacter cryoconitis]MBB5637436.1 RNA polymerase sigma-70 factor (ECF subfamily) [Pedobacter cryoconitis]